MKFKFHKMQGCGNDFLLMDCMNDEPPNFYRNEIVQLCDRHYGIGADGFLILMKSQDTADAAWKFFNSDGSPAEMCGNAARCAVRFLQEKYFPGEEPVSIETGAGLIKGKLLDDKTVEITLFAKGNLKFEYTEKIISTEKNIFTVFCIDTGVPHAVLEVKDIFTYPIGQVGRLLVKHPVFGPAGSNITFFQRLVGNRIRSTTYERGVYRETFACGTGAAAAAIIYTEQYLQDFPVEVAVPGGDLAVEVSPVSKMLLLRGPAEYLFQVELEALDNKFEPPALYGERRRPGA
jgi:diaminopimelate epimerase